MSESTFSDSHAELDSSEQSSTTEISSGTTRSGRLGARIVMVIIRGIPTLIVLAGLVGLAWFGHQYGWKIPQYSELFGTQQNKEVAWCDEHGVKEADCISCNADLMPKGELFGWCGEHGVHECVLHHPQLAQTLETPMVSEKDFARAKRAIEVRPRTKNDSGCKMHLRRIQFPTIEAVDRAGIDISLVDRGEIVETIAVTGEVVFDPTRVTQVSSRASGNVAVVLRNVGDHVERGEIIAVVDAVDVGKAKSNLMQALVQLEFHEKTLARVTRLGGAVIPEKKIQEAESAKRSSEVAVTNAIQSLSNLGLPLSTDEVENRSIEQIRELLQSLGLTDELKRKLGNYSETYNLIPIIAPRRGIVVARNAVAGEVIQTGKTLFTIADNSQMWLLLNVRSEEANRIALGQKVVFRPDGMSRESTGSISWISADADAETRTVRVRAELSNESGKLRNETFGSGEIVLREEANAIVVPNDAIHWEGCCHVAFVRDKDYFKDGSYKVFHTRSIRPGAVMNGQTEIIAGLLPGEVVVTKGSGVLRAELLKGNLGAG